MERLTYAHGMMPRNPVTVNIDFSNSSVKYIEQRSIIEYYTKAWLTINLSFNRIEDLNIPAVFKGLVKLHLLNLSYNRIHNIHPDALNGLPALETLLLNNNLLHIIKPDSFKDLSNLKTLHLQNNYLKVISDITFVKQYSLEI